MSRVRVHRRVPARAEGVERVVLRSAALAGGVTRLVLLVATGVLGPVLICVGLALVYAPLALVAAGLFLLAADRRI